VLSSRDCNLAAKNLELERRKSWKIALARSIFKFLKLKTLAIENSIYQLLPSPVSHGKASGAGKDWLCNKSLFATCLQDWCANFVTLQMEG